MTPKNRARSSSLFLMELILAILFFSVASAVCVQFFVKSHLLNLESKALTHAVNECSGAAEIISTADSLTDGLTLLQAQYPHADVLITEKNGAIRVYYDDSFSECQKPHAAYMLDIDLTYNGQMIGLSLSMVQADAKSAGRETPIYQLETKHYIARETNAHEK